MEGRAPVQSVLTTSKDVGSIERKHVRVRLAMQKNLGAWSRKPGLVKAQPRKRTIHSQGSGDGLEVLYVTILGTEGTVVYPIHLWDN